MKKSLIFCALIGCALSFSCGKTENPTPTPDKPDEPVEPVDPVEPDVPKTAKLVLAGQEAVDGQGYYNAAVWIDGQKFLLSKGEHDAFCNAVYTYKDSVFIAGCEAVGELIDDGYYDPYNANNGVVYAFKIGEEAKFSRTVHSDVEGNSTASDIAYSNGNIYTSGFDSPGYDRRALYWKNGEKFTLTDGSTDALAYCIAVDGDDVYVGGYIQSADFKREGAAVIWKNGVAQKLTSDGVLAKVNKIQIEDGHIYAAGAYKNVADGTSWQGAIWIDGELTLFTDPASVEVGGLYVKDGKWIINGNMSTSDSRISAFNWYSDGHSEEITPEMDLCQGLGVLVHEDDTYNLGAFSDMDYTTFETINKGYLWKNKEAVDVDTTAPNDFTLWDFAFAIY